MGWLIGLSAWLGVVGLGAYSCSPRPAGTKNVSPEKSVRTASDDPRRAEHLQNQVLILQMLAHMATPTSLQPFGLDAPDAELRCAELVIAADASLGSRSFRVSLPG
jgi:hypothetical protein